MKLNPPYKHLVQKPSLCGPACLQMVILRRDLGWIDQEEIAKELGARIGRKQVSSFNTKLKIAKDEDETDRGLQLKEFKEKKVHDFFAKHKLSLKAEVFFISQVKNPKSFIQESIKAGNDLMVNFHHKPFHKEKNWGHFVLVSEISGDKVTLCDPGTTSKIFWQAPLEKLVRSMEKKYDPLERGFVVFSSSNKFS